MQLSPLLRSSEGNGLLFWCPGCGHAHRIQHGEGPGPRWQWNGNADKPTFTPSVLVTWSEPSGPKVCHSFVTDGRIQFLADSTHGLAGKTVDLHVFPGGWGGTA